MVGATAELTVGQMTLNLTLTNRGVAPFYRDWPVMAVVRSSGGAEVMARLPFNLSTLQPATADTQSATLDLSRFPPGEATVQVGIPNPMEGGKPLRFANADRANGPSGRLSLGSIRIR